MKPGKKPAGSPAKQSQPSKAISSKAAPAKPAAGKPQAPKTSVRAASAKPAAPKKAAEPNPPATAGSTPLKTGTTRKPTIPKKAETLEHQPAPAPETKAVSPKPAVAPAASKPAPKAPSKKPATAPAKAPRPAKPKPLNIPPILLEGDLSPAPKVTGPGARYALTPPVKEGKASTVPATPTGASELPEGYGTRRLFLAARDPRWLYASWDLTTEQQREYNQRSRDGHLILRVYAEHEPEPVAPDVHVNPESRNFFINVPRPETRYWAELGLHTRAGAWEQITKSQSTFTPPDAPAKEVGSDFATIPVQVTFEQVVKTVEQFVTGNAPLLEAVIAAQEGRKVEHAAPQPSISEQGSKSQARIEAQAPNQSESAPNGTDIAPPQPTRSVHIPKDRLKPPRTEIPIRVERAQPWSAERREALVRLINIDSYRRVWMGSIEITELVRRQLQEEIASIAAAELAQAAAAQERGPGEALFAVSSPLGGELPRRDRKFWFKVNAELIVYGATEPDARVMIADRVVKLRPDGTFSFRFALPDGRYDLPASASSADGVEIRDALLEFSRSTEYHGHVEPHPQDERLRTPRAENI